MLTHQRLRSMYAGSTPDRGVYWPDHGWPETRTRWLAEGMNPDQDFGFDLEEYRPNIEIGYMPRFETGPIADEGEFLLIRDVYGIIRRISKTGRSDIAQYVSFPVSNRADWDELRGRLDMEVPERFGEGWIQEAREKRESGEPITIGGGHLCGFFSLLRELFGDEEVYYLLYDDPGLANEIIDFQTRRLKTLLTKTAREITVDRLFIWEDMCYKNGPLISPELFERFFLPAYGELIDHARELDVPIIDVDSDGKIDELIPLWIQAGVTMLNPFEVQSGMDVVRVTAKHGDRIVVRGGIDKRELAKGRAAIDGEIERIRPAYETGRYIPCADHAIPPDVSYDDFRYYLDRRAELVGI